MRRPLVMGNWKMNGRLASAQDLMSGIASGIAGFRHVEVVVCPPYPFLSVYESGTPLGLGAQNVAAYAEGAYTGEVSAAMLGDVGCQYVIVGHSERRTLFAESDDVVAEKFFRVQDAGMVPVLCVGETADERDAGQTESVVGRQIQAVIARVGNEAFKKAVIAYEPVWAIGTGRAASPAEAQAVHRFIRQTVAASGAEAADALRILYGGSVKAQNAPELLAEADVDGGLIGGASLNVQEFVGICQAGDARGSKGS